MKKIKPITEEQWALCNEWNRKVLDDFLNQSPLLSEQSKKVYRSNLMIWFNWVRENLNNKPQYEIKPAEYLKFQTWLIINGHGPADVNNKRAAISSLCNYIEENYIDTFPKFKTCITHGVGRPVKL